MTNREKFAEQILDIACNGNWMAANKATLEPITCQELQYQVSRKSCIVDITQFVGD